jgi:serine/threonine-protein kinase
MTDPSAALREGLRDRYAFERELGRGGMATVYLARDLRHDRPVALKVLHPELAATLGPERFLREIKLAARLQHPHILTVYDSGEAGGRLWFTMPYVEGESLRDRLRRERQLPIADAVRLTREAALALDFAHRHDAVHRDIKPENILLVDGQALVADFGIARALGGGPEERLTETGLAIGTPAYMSPEQAVGDKGVDGRTDIYSLGVVLYEMIAGETPFAAPTAQAMIARRMIETPRSLHEIRDTVPEPLAHAVSRALAKSPADRFATAAEFARALEAAERRNGGTAEVGSGAKVISRPSEPSAVPPFRRSAVVLIAGFLLGLGVLFGWLRSHGTSAPVDGNAPRLVAVLPFQNLGDSTEEYFADGMTDEIRGKLATLPGMQVIASGSAGQYKNSTKSPAEIARELGVQYLLTGKIRWEKGTKGQSRVRVSPELVQVTQGSAPTTRWQQPFDASLTDVFQVQADIAARVAQALNVALATRVQQQLAERPTANLAAYDAYLKGVEVYGLDNTPANLRKALSHFEQAVALDTSFAPAWARLSQAASLLYAQGVVSPALAAQSRAAADRALALAPDRPEGRVAMGDYLRRIELDNERALAEYSRGRRTASSDAELIRGIAIAEAGLGNWDSSLAHIQQAQVLDPRSLTIAIDVLRNLTMRRKYSEARDVADRALALQPTLEVLEWKAMTYLGEGNLDGARAGLRSPPSGLEPAAIAAYVATYYDLFWALDDEQQKLLLRLGPTLFDNDRGAWGLALAGTHALRGDQARARAYADSARIAMDRQLRDAPDDPGLNIYQATALAYLGRKAEAMRMGKRGLELLPVSRDAFNGAYFQHQLVRIYLLVGEPELALDQLEPLLRLHYFLSPAWLRIDPTFDPLRKNPRFQRLVGER